MTCLQMFWWLFVLPGTLFAQAREWRVLVESDENVNQIRAYLGMGEKGAGVDENWMAEGWQDVVKIADGLIAKDKKDHAGHAVKYLALLELKGDRTAATLAAVRALKDLGGNPEALGKFINLALYTQPRVSDYQLALMALVPVVPEARNVASVRIAHIRALAGCGKVKEAVVTNRDIVKDLGGDKEALRALVEGLSVTQGKVGGKGDAMKELAAIARQAMDKVLESRRAELALRMTEHQLLYQLEGKEKAAHELGEKIIAEGQKNNSLNNWLWYLMTRRETAGKYPALCLQAARKLAGQNPSFNELDTIAVALFQNGLVEEALDFQKRALQASGGNASKGMQRRLKMFEQAAARQRGSASRPASRPTAGR